MVRHRSPVGAGPRADAIAHDHLPTLTPGVDRLPSRCSACRSALLTSEPPLGRHQRGLVACGVCSAMLCWLDAPLAPIQARPRPVAGGSGERPSPPSAVVVRRPLVTRAFARVDGCGPACSAIYGHDPTTHEQYGYWCAVRAREKLRRDVVRTGPLAIDYGARAVTVDGVDCWLSPHEYAAIAFLGEQLGAFCDRDAIVEAIWGPADVALNHLQEYRLRWHTLRVHVARARAKLGPAGSLVETRPGFGYRLLLLPPTPQEDA